MEKQEPEKAVQKAPEPAAAPSGAKDGAEQQEPSTPAQKQDDGKGPCGLPFKCVVA